DRLTDGLETEEVLVARQGGLDRAHHNGDVVVRSEPLTSGALHGRYSPHSARSAPAISTRVTLSSTHALIRGSRFSVPRAASPRRSSASSASRPSRPARTARVLSTWRRSVSGSIRWGAGRSAPPSVKAFTPTTTCSRPSTARCAAYAASAISPCWYP